MARSAEVAEEEAVAARDRLVALGADTEAERARRLLQGPIRSNDGPGHVPVTRREREVLGYLVDALTNRQIAEQMVVSDHTVHRHVTNILRKLELPSRTAAAAMRSNLLGDVGA